MVSSNNGGRFGRVQDLSIRKDDAKAAAVVAQRAGNIVTQTRQPHIYNALDGNGYNRTWLPGELVENDPEYGGMANAGS